ncbi:MAG: protein kinase [Acutalibacteraceae bacterium]|nr:protein kinase [Oscillospiraceae bacterium]
MNEQDIKKILPEWTLSYILSEKRGEKLYQAERTSGDMTKYAAVRAISIPADKEELNELRAEYPQEDEFKKKIADMMKRKKAELQLLRSFCSKPGIVCMREIYDISNSDETSYLIVARYDYIETLDSYIRSNGLTIGAALRMGIDICKGLENFRKLNMIHGNVTPENIYVNDNGRFKLGGFDIDIIEGKKPVDKDNISSLRYASPEACNGGEKVFSSDVYSLGLVLYGLLNGGKLPFENEYSQKKAFQMRISGEPIPRPAYNAGKLTDIVMKACSFDTKQRYVTPYYMRKALEEAFDELQQAVLDNKADLITQNSSPMMTFSDNKRPEKNIDDFNEKTFDEMAEKKRREKREGRKNILMSLGAMTVILLLCAAVYFGVGRSVQNYGVHLEKGYDYVYTGEKKEPEVTLKGLKEGKDYIVSYSQNTAIGTAKVTVTGIGRFRGKKTKEFEILPEACDRFEATNITDSSVTLSWDQSEHGKKYYIYIRNEETDSWDKLETVSGSQDSCSFAGLKPDTEYGFRIRAVYTTGGKEYKSKSTEVFVKTLKTGDKA